MWSTCQNPPAPWLASWDLLSGTQTRLHADLSEGTQALPRGMLKSWSVSQCCYCLAVKSCLTFCKPMDCSPPGPSVHGIFPGKHTGVSCHFLLQGIFPTQGSNPHLLWLLHRQGDSLLLSHQGSLKCIYQTLNKGGLQSAGDRKSEFGWLFICYQKFEVRGKQGQD